MANIHLNNYYFAKENGIEKQIDVNLLLKDASQNFKLQTTVIPLVQNTDKEIYCTRKITAADVCIDRGALLTIAASDSASGKEEKSYTFTRNNNGRYFFNKIDGSSPNQKIKAYEIRIEITHTETCGYVEIKDPDKI